MLLTDKEYDDIKGILTLKNSHLDNILRQVRSKIPFVVEKLMLIDSLEMTEEHRKQIAASCQRAEEEKIVIIHGTDTMTITAKYLAQLRLKKSIILTGAMIPYVMPNSDAVFNLGASIMGGHLLPPDVYVVMNGRYFAWDNVIKNKKEGVFEELNEG